MNARATDVPQPIELPATFTRREEREGTAMVPLPVNATPMQMLAVAMNRGYDVSTLKELKELSESWERREAEKAYNDALATFKAEAVEIIKRKRVNFTNAAGKVTDYKHAELADVIEAVGPALSKHGFAWGWKTKQEAGAIEVTCELRHRLGHMETVTLSAPPDDSGGKNKVQQIISTVTYLERHTLKAACGVSEKGEDSDGIGAGSVMSAEEIDAWVAKIKATTTDAKAKDVCASAIAAADEKNDLAAYKTFKEAHKEHVAFMKEAK
jgi:hypothetical protein